MFLIAQNARPGMLLDAHMLQHSVKRHTKRAARVHTRVHTQKNERAHSKTVRTHTGTVRKKSGMCHDENSCSFLLEKRDFLLTPCKMQPVSQDINQSAMLRPNAGSWADSEAL